jgi:hypothetical protein
MTHTKRTHLSTALDPAADAVEVESVRAAAPCYGALLSLRAKAVCLTIDAFIVMRN